MRRYRLEIRGREFVIDVDDLAANRFAVTVGEESYEVELAGDEDLPEATITPAFAPAHAPGVPPRGAHRCRPRADDTQAILAARRRSPRHASRPAAAVSERLPRRCPVWCSK